MRLGGIATIETGTIVSDSADDTSHLEQTDAKGAAAASVGSCACLQGRRSLAKDACLVHAEIKVSVTKDTLVLKGCSNSRASHRLRARECLICGPRPLTRFRP